ncbi:MAG TPA: hypothetical protein ENG83_09705 [Nitrospirae bacterium]|nr:hypothetical protein BMS3Abin06_02297 [bacterium BMS3Abin06]HDH12449.1 hypothetical protein [Nitrospirota bacterium]HDZ02414.1 hypothetical protein [Nitrospirota bacterium]
MEIQRGRPEQLPLLFNSRALADKKIVYVGEVHDVSAHHAVYLEIIAGIYRRHRKIAIGMEMFQKPFQGILDGFIAGRQDDTGTNTGSGLKRFSARIRTPIKRTLIISVNHKFCGMRPCLNPSQSFFRKVRTIK